MTWTNSTSVRYLSSTILALSMFSFGQNTATPVLIDGNVPSPASQGVLGQKDPAAIAELANHRAAVGQSPWGGMQATGKITYAADDIAYDATLSNMGMDRFRLDSQTSKGPVSIRIHGRLGKIQDATGTISAIPPDTAFLGLFPFELARGHHLSTLYMSLLDHGLTTIDGVQLHRITFEFPSFGRTKAQRSQLATTIDLYFDPTSNLLIKSVCPVSTSEGRKATFKSVVTYSDYRTVGTSTIPFRFTETLDGQQMRTLQLSDVQLNPALTSMYFEFERQQ